MDSENGVFTYATRRRPSTCRSQLISGFEHAQIWSTNYVLSDAVLFPDSSLTSDECRVGGPSVCVIRVSTRPFDRIEGIRRKGKVVSS
jgi:hypothetical protein